ncbi:MAG: hypothetical protein JWN04_3295 [Myxococcaceae bacterium]|nr:hypothetical protein [Myxococcaceae bacterium]
MKRGILSSVLVVSLLGTMACGDDAQHDVDENPAQESDGGEVRYSADGSVIRPAGGPLDGGADTTYRPSPSSGDAGDEGESADGGRRGRGNGGGGPRAFDAGAHDGGRHPGPGVHRDGGERAPVERDGGPRSR